MKKKILALCLVVALAVTAVTGVTLAYFTDTDSANNTFSVGNVKIDLLEKFDSTKANLIPGKDIQKEVTVKNIGANDAYVRVHIAIPTELDDGDPNFNASHNFLHFNFSNESVADGQWSWIPEYTTGVGYKGNGAGNWNFYTTTIGEESYNVYVVTYRTALKSGETTSTPAMTKVYLDATVDAVQNEDGSFTYKDTKGNEVTLGEKETIDIKVFAEGVQAEGFADAYEAFKAAFDTPSSTNNPWAK